MEIDLLNFSGSAKKAYQLQERGSHEQWANQSEVLKRIPMAAVLKKKKKKKDKSD